MLRLIGHRCRNDAWILIAKKIIKNRSTIFMRPCANGLLLSFGLSRSILAKCAESNRTLHSQVAVHVYQAPVATTNWPTWTRFKKFCIVLFWLQRRCIILTLCFIPLVILYPLSLCSARLKLFYWNYILLAIRCNGPAFVKFGQWASTRRDIFSKPFCDTLSSLHTHAYTHSVRDTIAALKKSMGNKWNRTLTFLAETPVGSGCVAQVHEGYWMDKNGSAKVAVKVIHPYIVEELNVDLYVMDKIARLLLFLSPKLKWIDPVKCFNQFKIVLEQQVNMEYEARNLELFAKNFENESRIKFPKVYFASPDVLVESYEEGVSMKDFVNNCDQVSVELKRYLAKTGVRALLKMIFWDNWLHADLHPGNIIIQPLPPPKPKLWDRIVGLFAGPVERTAAADAEHYRLLFIDAGMAVRLSRHDLNNFKAVFAAIVAGEGDKVGELLLDRSPYEQCPDPVAFKQQVAQLVSGVTKTSIALNQVDVSLLMSDLFSLVARHRVQVDSSFTCVVLAVIVLEGLGRFLDPQLDLLNCAKPFVKDALY